MYFAFVIFVLIDQATKAYFADRGFSFLNFDFHPVRNYALPFGIDLGRVWNFGVLAVITVAATWYISKLPTGSRLNYIGKSMFFAGVGSNLVDRIIFGYVRDFIDLNMGFVFNFADVFIVLGLIIILATSSTKTTAASQQ